jgi:hypothetical protein
LSVGIDGADMETASGLLTSLSPQPPFPPPPSDSAGESPIPGKRPASTEFWLGGDDESLGGDGSLTSPPLLIEDPPDISWQAHSAMILASFRGETLMLFLLVSFLIGSNLLVLL